MRCDYLKKHHTLTWHTQIYKLSQQRELTSPQSGASESQTELSASYLLPVYTQTNILRDSLQEKESSVFTNSTFCQSAFVISSSEVINKLDI